MLRDPQMDASIKERTTASKHLYQKKTTGFADRPIPSIEKNTVRITNDVP
jgi:hypothetical protein